MRSIKMGRRAVLAAGFVFLILTIRMLILTALGNNTLMLAGVTTALFVYGCHFQRLIKIKWLNVLIISAFLLLLGFIIFLMAYGRKDTVDYKEDVVIVLGAGLRGERLSPILQSRLDQAFNYYTKNPNALFVVTGGQGSMEDITEALAMERYLISKGIPAAYIVKEEQASSTYENLLYSQAILEAHFEGDYIAAIITSEFHIYRAAQFAKMLDIDSRHQHASTPFFSILPNIFRECAAVIKLWIFKY